MIRIDCTGCVCRYRLAYSKPYWTTHREQDFLCDDTLHAPHLLDLEVTQVLKRLALQRAISKQRAGATM